VQVGRSGFKVGAIPNANDSHMVFLHVGGCMFGCRMHASMGEVVGTMGGVG
jgi:hypothetical protein